MQPLGTKWSGVTLVAVGAAFWGLDGLFRRGLSLQTPAATVVFWEHLILVAVTFPLLIRFRRRRIYLSRWDLVALLLIGIGASAVATMLFTHAFSYGNPTTPLLLQKLQPLIAVLGARLVLSERVLPRFARYFVFAVGGAFLISFPEPTSIRLTELAPAAYAVGAAALWAMGTVLGRRLTPHIRASELTALRFAIGLPASIVIVILRGEVGVASSIGLSELRTLTLLALIPGLAALTIYYRGLARTPASIATLAELAFPLTAILIGLSVFDTVPTTTQWVGISVLTVTILAMSRAAQQGSESLGVHFPEPVTRSREPNRV